MQRETSETSRRRPLNRHLQGPAARPSSVNNHNQTSTCEHIANDHGVLHANRRAHSHTPPRTNIHTVVNTDGAEDMRRQPASGDGFAPVDSARRVNPTSLTTFFDWLFLKNDVQCVGLHETGVLFRRFQARNGGECAKKRRRGQLSAAASE